MPLDLAWLATMGLPEILLWLLTFAIVYGVLEKVKFIDNREVNAIIAIVTGFLVLLATPIELITVLSSMSQSLVLIVLAILVLFIFAEVAGFRTTKTATDQKGNQVQWEETLFTENKNILTAGILLVMVLVFIGSGGLGLLGWNVDLTSSLSTSMLFFIVVIVAILWMISPGKQ